MTYLDLGPIFEGAEGYYTANRPVTFEEYETAARRLGRNARAALLYDLWRDEKLDLTTYPESVAAAWTRAEYPERLIDSSGWVDLFDEAGYTNDGSPAQRPEQAFTLYRGGSVEEAGGRGFGMSWTMDLTVAKSFAFGRLRGRPRGVVYTAEVLPCGLLAFIHKSGRNEAEYVVDITYLDEVRVLLDEDGDEVVAVGAR